MLQAALARGIAQRLVFALNRPPGGLGQGQGESARLTLRQLAGGGALPDAPDAPDGSAAARAAALAAGALAAGAPAVVESVAARTAGGPIGDDAAATTAAAAAATAATAGTAAAAATSCAAASAAVTAAAVATAGPDWASLKELAEHILVLGPRAGRAAALFVDEVLPYRWWRPG